MQSIIVPIDRYPWFVDAVLCNLADTIDAEAVDLVFVTSDTVCEPLAERLRRGDGFRWVRAPLQQRNNHLPLLDWIVRNDAELSEWIVVQHCDCFHREDDWLSRLQDAMRADAVAIESPRGPTYRIAGRPWKVAHDYLGAYRRSFLVNEDLRFQWGRVSELSPSPELLAMIDARRVRGVDRDTWLDGSALIGLELGARFRKRVAPFHWHHHAHVWQFYKWGNRIERRGDVIHVRGRPEHHYPLMIYSLVSSFYWSKDDPKVFPFALYPGIDRLSQSKEDEAAWLLSNLTEWHPNCAGEFDTLGLTVDWTCEDDSIRFDDR